MATEFANLPGVKINEVQLGSPPISGVSTSRAGFVGNTPRNAFPNEARLVTSADQFIADYVKDLKNDANSARASTAFSHAVLGFFQNGGGACYIVNVPSTTATPAASDVTEALKLLEKRDDIQIVAAPGSIDATVYSALIAQAEKLGDRFAILDSPPKVGAYTELLPPAGSKRPTSDSQFAAFYYPRIQVPPQLPDDPKDTPIWVAPTGHVAGVYARVDANRGVHKAPANERILGALGVEDLVKDADQDVLNNDGIDVIRRFVEGTVIWGARTLTAASAPDKTFRYLNVRRLTTFIEQSLRQGLRFAVFEPNNLALRKTITRSVRGFLDGVWRDGALFGATADEAYYVRFPDSFNTDDDRQKGRLVVEIGIRVSYPVEFLIIRIGLLSQSASSA